MDFNNLSVVDALMIAISGFLTVFIMLVSGVILYLVYGVGARDLGERLEARERRRRRVAKLTGLFKKEPAAVAAAGVSIHSSPRRKRRSPPLSPTSREKSCNEDQYHCF